MKRNAFIHFCRCSKKLNRRPGPKICPLGGQVPLKVDQDKALVVTMNKSPAFLSKISHGNEGFIFDFYNGHHHGYLKERKALVD